MSDNVPIVMPFADIERLAVAIARSGLFGIRTPEQAMALMMISQAEGRHPALAARDYDVIQGRPSKKAEAMLRDFLEAGGKVQWHALTDVLCEATFSHAQGGTAKISWDTKRAVTAGLAGKDNWKKFPRQMLRSRVVSEGVRTVWPLATSGLYVPEEVAEFGGPTIDAVPPDAVKPVTPDPEPGETPEDYETRIGNRREQINREVPIERPSAQDASRVPKPSPFPPPQTNGEGESESYRRSKKWIHGPFKAAAEALTDPNRHRDAAAELLKRAEKNEQGIRDNHPALWGELDQVRQAMIDRLWPQSQTPA